MYSKDSLLRLSLLINMGGGGKVKRHLQGSLVPCAKLTQCDKGFCESKKKINKAHRERKMLASRDEAIDIPCSVLAFNCIPYKLYHLMLITVC